MDQNQHRADKERTTELEKANARLLAEIADRELAETTLRASEERFRVALAGAPITVFNQDRELRYTWMNNPQWAMHSRDVLGKRDEDLFAPETARRLTELKRRVL